MDTCIICNDDIQNGSNTVKLREKGSIGINNASIESCYQDWSACAFTLRRSYVNPIVIKGLIRKSTSPALLATPPTLRSEKQFSFQEDCLFCVLEFLEDNDDEQLTVKDLVDRMKALCGDEAYSQPYMKQKVQEHYRTSILITELNGKENVVTFRQTASTIIHNFYKESQLKKSDEDSKLCLLKTAAALIKSEIRSMPVDKNYYPSNNDILSHEKHIPESLALFLTVLFSEKDASLTISSIGQAIMQATRPRLVIEPLQLGLAIQMHHMFGSRFLVDTLSNMGFCSSYSEVQKFETSAVISKQENTSNHYDESHCLQYVADNVDHNLCTVDGNNTFHGMGIISCITPAI
ncbi:Hypothetical predicted protein [Mytilus galloprovincialis]|uniref:Uncharacterized protein n=1 Tax=Mytilus galloprovincialis TaxID=29158 RepID=A0A8B6DYA1_MYTGA|nr:Hypothetical predicted protein [Mytilus galloprovincialis]